MNSTVEARQERIYAESAWELLQDAEEICVGQGRNFVILTPQTHGREEILSRCLGRSGTLRAPALRIGRRFLIGFNEEMYRTCLR